MSETLDIPQICGDFLQENISYQQLLRAICEYEGWIVPTYPSDDGSGEVPALAMLQSSDGRPFWHSSPLSVLTKSSASKQQSQ